ncbi:putative ABC transport system ATP-binding protein [Amycolatopsis bartoniae]|uniref:ABC transporter n=1 Tax=Amycolatopsis bartoniae TaxID=941986 RepID=A0A8H9M7G3_9PSEU|nr:ABC transporter ATP-binding protein [Amycolatopsis bartoniae]MBB2935064.1 putative ABC transport system ATP-binding protein [Amycolatopsis bartoniae]TVT02543.1 ABC transporter ATP-binding protein [Amycolatopsis bartoniae]GHF74078.1 ABC transporter [Amycolatopsis bartoniae]
MTTVEDGLVCAVRMESVSKVYGSGETAVRALDRVSIGLRRGSFTALMGPSGSGKSTFLHCAAGLDRPTSGRVLLGDTELTGQREAALTELRRNRIGFVFQAYNLLDALTVEQNIVLPLRLANRPFDPEFLAEVVRSVEVNVPLDRRPGKLSGGQQQRVAIARALVTRPDVMFLDEPTGALDTRTARQVLSTLRQTVNRWGQTALMVTHDPVAASYADSVVFLADGRIAGEVGPSSPEAIAEHMTRLGEW